MLILIQFGNKSHQEKFGMLQMLEVLIVWKSIQREFS